MIIIKSDGVVVWLFCILSVNKDASWLDQRITMNRVCNSIVFVNHKVDEYWDYGSMLQLHNGNNNGQLLLANP